MSEGGPGPLGVHVVGRDRGDPAPVVDAGVQQRGQVVGEVRRRLDVHLGRQHQAGHRDGPEQVVRRARLGPGHGRPGLGRKFWTMTSWTWPKRACEAAMACRAASWPARSSPMPTRIPVVKGMCSSPAASSVARRRAGSLSGALRWASRSVGQRLDHHALAGRDRAQLRPARRGRGRRHWRGGGGRSPPGRGGRRGRGSPPSRRTRCRRATGWASG